MEIKSLGYRTDLLLLELSGSEFQDAGEYVVMRTPDEPGLTGGGTSCCTASRSPPVT